MTFHCGFNGHSPAINDVEHLFICLLAIRISSLQKCLFSALPHFKIGFWVFFPIHSMSPLAILDIYHEQYERQNDRILKEELLRSVGAQYATGDQWRNNSRKNEGMEPKKKQTKGGLFSLPKNKQKEAYFPFHTPS